MLIKPIKINRCDIFVLLNIAYKYQAGFINITIIQQILLYILISWCLLIGWKYLLFKNNEPKIIKAIAAIIWIYFIYGFYLWINPIYYPPPINPHPKAFMTSSLTSVLPILVFYNYGIKGYIRKSHFIFYIILLIPITIAFYLIRKNEILLENALGESEITNNVGYLFVTLIPLVYVIKNKYIKSLCLIIIFIFTFISFKRGAIMICGICIAYILYLYYKDSKGIKKIVVFFSTVLLISIVIYYIIDVYNNSLYLQERVESTLEGNSSGRDRIIENIMDSFWKSNLLQYIFGHGGYSTIGAGGNFAHNDWIEFLYCHGIIGVTILFYYYYSLVKTLLKESPYISKNLKIAFQLLVFICIIKTFFSMSINTLQVSQTLLIGFMASILFKIKQIDRNVIPT